jgi:hypothetical protein
MAIANGYQVSIDITYLLNRSILPLTKKNLSFDVKTLDLL